MIPKKIKPAVILLILLLNLKLKGQDISGSITAPAGAYSQVGNILVDWSVGNLMPETFSLPGGQLMSQGFLQPENIIIHIVLNFDTLGRKTYGDVSFELNGSTNKGSIIYTSSNDSVAKIVNGNIVQITGAGEADITAAVEGTNIAKTQKLTVDKAGQFITFDLKPILTRGETTALIARASSGLPVDIRSLNAFVARVNGQILTAVEIGKASIQAGQAGNKNYLPAELIQEVEVVDPNGEVLRVPYAISPNGDGINDVLVIYGIESFPDNHVVIVNRNGTKVYEVRNYDNSQKIFAGQSNSLDHYKGAAEYNKEYLPQGTYFYVITYKDTKTGRTMRKNGYFVQKY